MASNTISEGPDFISVFKAFMPTRLETQPVRSSAVAPERRSVPREKCVHFRFKLRSGYDFQAVAWDASTIGAAFEEHFKELLTEVKSGYFETTAGMFEIADLKLSALPSGHAGLHLNYTSKQSPSPIISEQEFAYVMQKKAALQQRHEQLRTMNQAGVKSVIGLYTLMVLYAAAPFSSLHAVLVTGFFRVWGLGGLWLAMTAWFYCDRTFWRYGNHLFEQVFCMRQFFQMDKIAIGRSKLHNLYAILPSYGYSWDRAPSQVAPSGDPTHLSNDRIKWAAWFFKLVSFFPLMYFCLFLSMLLFPGQTTDINAQNKLEIYGRVLLGSSFVFFLWLALSMRGCDELMQRAFCARRIGVESPWPVFPDRNIDDDRLRDLRLRNAICIAAASCLSFFNFLFFLGWLLPQSSIVGRYVPEWLTALSARDHYSGWFGLLSLLVFAYWGVYKELRMRLVLGAAHNKWPTPKDATRRVHQIRRVPYFWQLSGPLLKSMKKLFFG